MWALREKEQLDYFKKIVIGHTTEEIIDLWYKKFGEKRSKNWVKDIKHRHGLHSGVDTKFKKGEVRYRYTVPLGSEIKVANGKIKIKVAEPDVWVYKHKWVWEQANGKMPRDKVLIFLDGDKGNCDLSNLELIDRKEELIMARKKLFFKHSVLTKTGISIARLDLKAYSCIKL